MRIKTLALGSAAALLALLGPATQARQAQPAAPALAAAPGQRVATPALWKVSDKDTTIYLFGTIHLLPEGIDWYNGKLASAFESTQELVTEIPDIPPGEAAALSLRMGTLPPGQSLRSGMTADQLAKYEGAMKSLGLPVSAFDRLKPWFAAVAMATLPLQKAGYSMDNGIEAQLDRRNKELGRPRLGLETLEYQLSLFDGLPEPVQRKYLFDVIDAVPTIPQEIGKMVDAWVKGDAEQLAVLLNSETDDPALYEALLTRRNENWAVWIDNRLDQPGVVFIAVGAGHLAGKDSVQELLRKQKIKAVRVQ
ncbi:MAG: TraB/GumN family protein [Novosphingobium sp.]